MICKNCGAQVDDSLLLCPYCQSENEKIAEKQQKQYIIDYKNKTDELKNVPDKVVKKSSKYVLLIAGIALAVFVVCLIIAYIYSNIIGDNSADKRNKHLEQLEEYYQDGDYEKIGDYLDRKDLYGASYEKYRSAYYMNDSMQWKIESIKNDSEYADTKLIESTLVYVFEDLSTIAQLEEDGFIYDEGEAMLEFREEYEEALKEYFLLEDEEIDEATKDYDEKVSYIELAEEIIDRLDK